jgi:hypothetical protein
MKRIYVLYALIAVGALVLLFQCSTVSKIGGGGSVSQEERILEAQGFTNIQRNYSDLFNRCAYGNGINFTATAPNGAAMRVAVCSEFNKPGYWLSFY